jgi:hypothetical protein
MIAMAEKEKISVGMPPPSVVGFHRRRLFCVGAGAEKCCFIEFLRRASIAWAKKWQNMVRLSRKK